MIILLSPPLLPSLALLVISICAIRWLRSQEELYYKRFLYGAFLTFPIMFLQYVLTEEGFFDIFIFKTYYFSSVIEEFFKWFVLLIAIYNHIEFDDPYDGILYGASISLGFATIENVLYLLSFGLDTAFMRALLPVSSHALFGVVMGYYYGRAKFSKLVKTKR